MQHTSNVISTIVDIIIVIDQIIKYYSLVHPTTKFVGYNYHHDCMGLEPKP